MMNYATSDGARASMGPPLELMFKGGARILEDVQGALTELRSAGDWGHLEHVSVAVSPSASYNTDDVIDYLDKVLLHWGASRKWRILMSDAYSAHLDVRVQELCWERGYLMVYIGGGCTGVLAV